MNVRVVVDRETGECDEWDNHVAQTFTHIDVLSILSRATSLPVKRYPAGSWVAVEVTV